MPLFAPAQFRMAVGGMTCPDISREEIVNACGVDDIHDGVNYTRVACVVATAKARGHGQGQRKNDSSL